MAVKHGLIDDEPTRGTQNVVPIGNGWERFLANCTRPAVLGGVSPTTAQRYRAVRDKHQPFCQTKGVSSWNDVDAQHAKSYGSFLDRQQYAPRTIYLELTLLIQVTNFLIVEKSLPESNRFSLKLQKPTGSDIYCFRSEQVDAMLQWCRQQAELHWMHPLLATLAMTGLRIGEAQGLR